MENVNNSIKKGLESQPVYNRKHLKAKTKSYKTNIKIKETYRNFDTSPDHGNLALYGYNIIRKDHLSKTKNERACIY